MPSIDDFRSWVLDHKLASAGSVLVLLAFGLGIVWIMTLSGSSLLSMGADQAAMERRPGAEYSRSLTAESGAVSGDASGAGGGSFVEVKEADFTVESNDVESDSSTLKRMADDHDGYTERSNKEVSDLYERVSLTVRVPRDRFPAFTDTMQREFNVESYSVSNFRISTQREVDELTILNKSMADYERIREDIKGMETDREKMELLMDVTERQLELERKEKNYERELSDKQQRGQMSTVRIELKDRRSVDIWPDNIWNRFKDKVKQMLDTVVTTLMDTITGSVTLFVTAIQYIVYGAVIIIPFAAAYQIARRAYRRYWPSARSDGE